MKSLRGHFLIASPHLADRNFRQSVVLMIHHDEEGAFGLVLNRPTNNTIRDVWELISEDPCQSDAVIHLGGPVPGPLLALHADPACSETEVVEGVHLAAHKRHIARLVQQRAEPLRLFTGYSGWGEGQLEGELEAGGWLTLPAKAADVFSGHQDLWRRTSRAVGLQILSPAIKRRPIPDDPSQN